jgi:transporter family-2 protein
VNLFPYAFALLGGLVTAMQVVVNTQARVRLRLEHPLQGALVSFLGGTLILIAICAGARFTWPDKAIALAAPWWVWFGGVFGIVYLSASIYLSPRLGVTLFLTLVVTGQLVGALWLDHYGWLGAEVKELNVGRIAGVAMVLVGLILVARCTPQTVRTNEPVPLVPSDAAPGLPVDERF